MKKHSLITVLAAALVGVSAAGFPAAPGEPAGIVAEAAESNGFQYTVSSNQVTITKYTGSATSVTIPDKINGKKVVAIGDKAFCTVVRESYYYPMNITSVTIPNTVKTIGEKAFYKAKLKTLVIQGAAVIKQSAFEDCTALESVQLNAGCTSGTTNSPFNGCTSLKKLNGQSVYRTVPDDNGYFYPIITSNQNTRKLLNEFFLGSDAKFVKAYSAALCEYVVETETRSWMSDAIKARQLHDWIIRHAHYDDSQKAPGCSGDTGMFFGYGLNGEAAIICGGYSAAYTALLTQAGIESYIMFGRPKVAGVEKHFWNLIKADGKYYQVDVTWDDTESTDTSISYRNFLKNRIDKEQYYNIPTFGNSSYFSLKNYNSALRYNYTDDNGRAGLNQCIYTYCDANADGILDCDFDFNGTVNAIDSWVLQQIGRGDMTLDGTITPIDGVLLQDFYAHANDAHANDAHSYWLKLCVQYNIYGL